MTKHRDLGKLHQRNHTRYNGEPEYIDDLQKMMKHRDKQNMHSDNSALRMVKLHKTREKGPRCKREKNISMND